MLMWNLYISISRCKPDAETYNALISAHARAGQWRWAMNIMDDMLRAAVCNCILPSNRSLWASFFSLLYENYLRKLKTRIINQKHIFVPFADATSSLSFEIFDIDSHFVDSCFLPSCVFNDSNRFKLIYLLLDLCFLAFLWYRAKFV